MTSFVRSDFASECIVEVLERSMSWILAKSFWSQRIEFRIANANATSLIVDCDSRNGSDDDGDDDDDGYDDDDVDLFDVLGALCVG